VGTGRLTSRALALALAALSCVACGSTHTVLVTPSGRVGPLQVNESTRADVISLAGKPESERHDRYDDYRPLDAPGYGCNGKPRLNPGVIDCVDS
jgi:hypothetical protein